MKRLPWFLAALFAAAFVIALIVLLPRRGSSSSA